MRERGRERGNMSKNYREAKKARRARKFGN
jgi:hypothetical protein